MQHIYKKFRTMYIGEDYKFPNKPKHLGDGSYGVCYALSRTLVVKITSSRREATLARKLIKKPLPYVWRVAAVQEYASYYAIIGERLVGHDRIDELEDVVALSSCLAWYNKKRKHIDDFFGNRGCWSRKKRIKIEKLALEHFEAVRGVKRALRLKDLDANYGNVLFDRGGILKLIDIYDYKVE